MSQRAVEPSGGVRLEVRTPPPGLDDALFDVLAGVPASWALDADGGLAIVVAREDAREAAAALDDAGIAFVASDEPARDWIAESAKRRRPVAIGRFLLDPHEGAKATTLPGRRRLFVAATRAFGTGSHESTRLALRLLLEEGAGGKRVLDVGCGVGTLALVAAAEGARPVVAFDVDPDAAFATRLSARANELPAILPFAGPIEALGTGAPFDLVVANLIAEELAPLLAAIVARLRPGGRIVTAGQLLSREPAWRQVLRAAGLSTVRLAAEGEWLGAVAEKA